MVWVPGDASSPHVTYEASSSICRILFNFLCAAPPLPFETGQDLTLLPRYLGTYRDLLASSSPGPGLKAWATLPRPL